MIMGSTQLCGESIAAPRLHRAQGPPCPEEDPAHVHVEDALELGARHLLQIIPARAAARVCHEGVRRPPEEALRLLELTLHVRLERDVAGGATFFGAQAGSARAAPMAGGFKPAGRRGAGYTLRDEVSV